ncbi:MAG TPA: methionyl-tRNA formyltransferase [Lentisphaeria bacterium]|nr:MAG: methionyl-tRNA formyltransferase [Lentisphaerae bacterium GWF2_49_21]HBC87705.1 methionyl-tRNA formyltransferase [Lentisphaeria bacterium]
MNCDKLKVYFLGSGRIAVPILSSLAESPRISLAGIGTQMDRPAGRKRHVTPTPVGEWCSGRGIQADKPASVNTPEFLEKLRSLGGLDMILVSSFGQILKQDILSLPRLGCINLHASLLPAYRGASPVQTAILNGDEKTGVCFMLMEKGLDTGPVFSASEYRIQPGQKADELEYALGVLASQKVESVLLDIASAKLKAVPQDDVRATYAGKIKKEHGGINWGSPARRIERMLRAYHPWPGIFFNLQLGARKLRMAITELACLEIPGTPGQVLKADRKDLIVACGEGAVSLKKVIPEGKREMSGTEFVQGCHGLEGMILGNG